MQWIINNSDPLVVVHICETGGSIIYVTARIVKGAKLACRQCGEDVPSEFVAIGKIQAASMPAPAPVNRQFIAGERVTAEEINKDWDDYIAQYIKKIYGK